ncbi:MAG TPA: BatA domain-containing protein [Candidatus Binatia bacterium]|nr:BatA domain-containing protein [Candidatus Binatia bacterium]
MEFLNPAALYALLLLPVLLIAHLIRRPPQRVYFSSLLLMREFAGGSRAGRSGVPPIFFLHLLLLTLLLLALAEPSLTSRAVNIALVLDNSASMQAVEGGQSRFQAGLAEAENILRGLPAGARVDLYALAPHLARIGEAGLRPNDALKRAAALKPLDVGEGAVDHGAELPRLAHENGYGRLYFVTDHPAEGQSATLRVITVGRPQNNLALTSLQVERAGLDAPRLEARFEVRSFSNVEEKFQLNIKAGGKIIATRAYTIAPGKSVDASLDGIPAYPFYEGEIAADDGLPLDNRRFAVAPPTDGIKILAISPRPGGLDSLRAIPGVDAQMIAPEAYRKGKFAPHAVEIFQYSAPAGLPDVSALLILPPSQNPLVRVADGAGSPIVTGWREGHPLTRYINFSLFRPSYARPLKLGLNGQAVIDGVDGALAVAFERDNHRYVALGFDPLPFLGQRNLPMSIFTLNLLQWLSGSQSSSVGTGTPLNTILSRGATLLGPKGEKLDRQTAALYQGIYRISAGATEYLAVNFDNAAESDLRSSTPIRISEAHRAGGERPLAALLSPYLLALALALLMLEWFINPRPAGKAA